MNHGRTFQIHSPRRDSIDAEEQRTWVAFYRRVGHDTALAAEVMTQLDGDAEMKRRHLALYLSCRQAVRAHKTRQARDKRIGMWLRALVRGALLQPFVLAAMWTPRALNRARNLLAELIPPATASVSRSAKRSMPPTSATEEPASPQVRKLLKEAEFAEAHASFQRHDSASSAVEFEQDLDLSSDSATRVATAKRR